MLGRVFKDFLLSTVGDAVEAVFGGGLSAPGDLLDDLRPFLPVDEIIL